MDSIPTYFGNPMYEDTERSLDLSLFGTVLVISPYKQLNTLVNYHFEQEMDEGSVLGLSANESLQRTRALCRYTSPVR